MNKKLLIIILVFGAFSQAICSKPGGKNSFSNFLINGQSNSSSYPFKPSDGIIIDTFPDTTFFLHNRILPIDDRGFVEFPIVGKVNVSQMTDEQLVKFIKDTYKNWLKFPNVYVKPLVRISLLGGFVRPGLYYIDINSSLWEAVHLAGGTVKEDGIYEMRWERDHDEENGDVTPLFENGTSLRAMGFKSGDQIWTPSPGAKTFWDKVENVLPIITFATSIWFTYYTYQSNQVLLTRK